MTIPTPSELRALINAQVTAMENELDSQHVVRYLSQTPPIFGTVDADEIEKLANEKLNKDHGGDSASAYIFGSAGMGLTHKANRAAFEKYKIIPHMLRDATHRDLSAYICGVTYPSPLILAPVGVQMLAHPDAELATSRAAAKCGVPFCISTAASRTMEEVMKEGGDGPKWFQLYWPETEDVCLSLLQRAKASGYTNLVVTLDTMLIGWRPKDLATAYLPFIHGVGCQMGLSDPVFMSKFGLEPTHERPSYPYNPDALNAILNSEDSSTHADSLRERTYLSSKWMQEHINSGWFPVWQHLKFLRENWEGPLIVKGIQAVSDAELAIAAGCDGIVVSNHGGRQVDGAIASIDALALIMQSGHVGAVQDSGKFTVLFDSGIRTGSDMFKALALGANGVMIGRLYMCGLALKGEAGVEAIIKQLLSEFSITMGLSGCRNLNQVSIMGEYLHAA